MPPDYGVCRPLVAASGGVAGSELRLPRALQQRLNLRSDPVSLAAYQAALVATARPVTDASRRALMRISAPRPGAARLVANALDASDSARLDALAACLGGANPVRDLAAKAWSWATGVSCTVAPPPLMS